jgi:hypothetical protein
LNADFFTTDYKELLKRSEVNCKRRHAQDIHEQEACPVQKINVNNVPSEWQIFLKTFCVRQISNSPDTWVFLLFKLRVLSPQLGGSFLVGVRRT